MGSVVVVLLCGEHGQVVQGHRHIRMVVSEEVLFDVERSLVEVLGVAQVAAGSVQCGEVVVVHAELVVDRAGACQMVCVAVAPSEWSSIDGCDH